ncbi:hypothetical protein SAMN03159443_03752 [Pseudomonas sp. NFACC15-1]|nr:hypothetical protein SAMN03159443_03752 [Pseudomonas sp. NFACC15-1]SDB58207.1 hypothetical protein SAMN03159290_04557 [Pseudomonas sp. NFACC13-1]SDW66373.1 hypothetical protein SAMN03159380_00943 [Pseudomonas sp. NFACC14]
MGMSHTALLNRVNRNDDSHRLNFEPFLQILVHIPLYLSDQFPFLNPSYELRYAGFSVDIAQPTRGI